MRFIRTGLALAVLLVSVHSLAAQSETHTPVPESTPEVAAINLNPANLTGAEDVAFAHFAHTSVDGPAIDLYLQELGDAPIVTDFTFGEELGDFQLPARNYTVVARAAGSGASGEVLAQMNWNYPPNTSWLIVFAGLASNYSLQLEPVNLLRDDIAPETARVRVINMIAGGPVVSVSGTGGEDLGRSFGWIGVVDREIAPATVTLAVTAQSGATLLTDYALEFPGAALTTLLLIGEPDGSPPVQIIHFSSPATASRIQLVNGLDMPIQIFLRPGNLELLASLDAGATSDWLTIRSGAVTFVAYAPGTGPRGQELAAWIGAVDPMRDVTITFNADRSVDDSAPVFSPVVTPAAES